MMTVDFCNGINVGLKYKCLRSLLDIFHALLRSQCQKSYGQQCRNNCEKYARGRLSENIYVKIPIL